LYASKNDLDQFYTNGDFTFNLTTLSQGLKNVTLNLGAEDDYPAAPALTNLAALQEIPSGTDVTLNWVPLSGWSDSFAVGNTIIEAEIQNSQGEEVAWIEFSQFTSASQCVIPAGLLWPGRSYRVKLYFTKIKDLDTVSYEGAMGVVGFASVTEFSIQTAGTPIMPTVTIEQTQGTIKLNVSGGENARWYVAETSSDLQRWLPQAEGWSDGSAFSFYDPDASYLKSRYYRLRDRASNESAQRNITIQGTVWRDSTQTTPVPGTVVGTSLDTRTTLTDSSGRFFLETDTPGNNYNSTPYTIIMQFGDTSKDFGPWTWGAQPREQSFIQNEAPN
jgi:hypothetical protein